MLKKIICFTPGLDSNLICRYFGDSIVEYQKVYFNLNSMYSNNELKFLSNYYCKNDYDIIYNLNLGDIENKKTAHVPNRNLLMVTMAAAKYNADEVILGGVADDRVSDNNDDFYNLASQVLSHTMGKDVFVYSPLSHKEKSEWVKELVQPNDAVDALKIINGSYSCFSPKFEETNLQIYMYDATGRVNSFMNTMVAGCRKCPACYRRLCALTAAGIYVPFDDTKMVINYVDSINKNVHPNRYKSAVDYSRFIKLLNMV